MRILSSSSSEKFYLNEYYYRKLGLIKIDDKIYRVDNLPDNLTVKGDLDLAFLNIKRLPKNLKIKGSLFLLMNTILKLPDGLKVEKNLDISNTNLTELPEDLFCKNLIADNSNIQKLEKITGCETYQLRYSSIKEIGSNIIAKIFDFTECKNLTKIGNNNKATDFADFTDCKNLVDINDFKAKIIYLQGTQVKDKRFFNKV